MWEEYGFTRASLAPVAEHQHRGLLNQVRESASHGAATLLVETQLSSLSLSTLKRGYPRLLQCNSARGLCRAHCLL